MTTVNIQISPRCLAPTDRDSNDCLLDKMISIVRTENRIDASQILNMTCIIGLACFFFLASPALIAGEPIGLDTLLELDLFDWTSIDPQQVLDECTLALSNKAKLKEDQICRLYLLRSVSRRLTGKGDAAVGDLSELLKLRPNDSQALRMRGECYIIINQYDKARIDFENLIKIQPKSGIGYSYLARCLEKRGDKESIGRLAEKAIALEPDEPQGYLVRATYYLSERKYEQGLKDLDQCIALRYGNGTMEMTRDCFKTWYWPERLIRF